MADEKNPKEQTEPEMLKDFLLHLARFLKHGEGRHELGEKAEAMAAKLFPESGQDPDDDEVRHHDPPPHLFGGGPDKPPPGDPGGP